MNHLSKRILTFLLSAVLLLSLCACGGSDADSDTANDQDASSVALDVVKRTLMDLAADDYILLLRGNLDELYLGKFSEEYMELVSSTEADCQTIYEDSMAYEADFFCYYFDIEHPTEAYLAELTELYKEIYSHAKYSVGTASSLDDTTYAVKVSVSPINIIQLMTDEIENGALDEFYGKYTDAQVEAMSEEEYVAYDEEWAALIMDLLKSQMPNIGYQEELTMVVQIVLADDIWQIGDTDLQAVDSCIIAYP